MTTLKLEVTLRSPALIGSGEGFGAVIDTDVVFDDIGIPYIPAKRIKGCLKEAAENVKEMFQQSDIPFGESIEAAIDEIFGQQGAQSGKVHFPNLTIDAYSANRDWLTHLQDTYPGMISQEIILDSFCELRQQTAIENKGEGRGVAKDTSLRTSRVLRKDLRFSGTDEHQAEEDSVEALSFSGDLDLQSEEPGVKETLALACYQLRHIGTKRNRGFGNVTCTLLDTSTKTEVLDSKALEELCTA